MQNDETHELCHKDTVEYKPTGKCTGLRRRKMWVRKAHTQQGQLGLVSNKGSWWRCLVIFI